MDIEKELIITKKKYISTKPSERFAGESKYNLLSKLDDKKEESARRMDGWFFARSIAFAAIILVLLGSSLVKAASAAKPGDPLYQVKLLGENIIVAVSNDPTIRTKNRAQEIIDLAKGNKLDKIGEATKEYKDSIKAAQRSGKSEEFEKRLENQEEKFQQTVQARPELSDDLKEAIKISREGRGEDVRGVHENNGSTNNGNQLEDHEGSD